VDVTMKADELDAKNRFLILPWCRQRDVLGLKYITILEETDPSQRHGRGDIKSTTNFLGHPSSNTEYGFEEDYIAPGLGCLRSRDSKRDHKTCTLL